MISVRARQALRTGHKWFGLAVALFIVAQGMTGVMLAFKDELSWRIDGALRSQARSSDRITPDVALDRALAGLGEPCAPRRLYFPKHERGVFLLKCTAAGGAGRIATVDQWSGTVLAAGPVWHFPFELADEWHLDWRLERPGRAIVGALGFALLTLAVSGLIVWWPGARRIVRALKPIWRGGARTRLRIFHRLVGPIAFLFIAIFITAGVLTAWRPWVEPLVGRVLPLAHVPAPPDEAPAAERLLPLADVERLALAALPGASVRDMRDDKGPYELLQVVMNPAFDARPRAADHAYVDRRSGRLLGTRQTVDEPAGTRLLGWVLPLHTGEAFALPGRLLMLAIGMAVVALAVSGTIAALRRS